MRKPDFCLCENKGADQLRSNCEADQRLCFRYTDSTLSLLIKSEISSFYAASGTVHVGLCQTWLETPKTGFLASRLKYFGFEVLVNQLSCLHFVGLLPRMRVSFHSKCALSSLRFLLIIAYLYFFFKNINK